MLAGCERGALLDIAGISILAGLRGSPAVHPDLSQLPAALCQPAAVFVTLHVDGQLSGCIGSVAANEPLAHGVAHHAWSAAFADPRLPPLTRQDYGRLFVEVSVLSSLTPVTATTRQELLSHLRPHTDGLLLAALGRQAVFLPKVWEQLPDADLFLDYLLMKAGLPRNWWQPSTTAQCFTTQVFGGPAAHRGQLRLPDGSGSTRDRYGNTALW